MRSKFKRVLSFVNKIYELLCYNSLKFIEHKSDDGGVLAVDTGERCLGFCEDLTPDDKVYKVQDKIFISSQDGAQNMEELKQNGVTHILNVGTGIENAFAKVINLYVQ